MSTYMHLDLVLLKEPSAQKESSWNRSFQCDCDPSSLDVACDVAGELIVSCQEHITNTNYNGCYGWYSNTVTTKILTLRNTENFILLK